MTLEKLKDASCSDGDCVFKITPEMKKGMRTNGGCSCLKDMRHGIGSRKTYAVMVLSQIASDAESALKEKDARIKELEDALKEIRDRYKDISECECDFYDDDGVVIFCDYHIAVRALGANG